MKSRAKRGRGREGLGWAWRGRRSWQEVEMAGGEGSVRLGAAWKGSFTRSQAFKE